MSEPDHGITEADVDLGPLPDPNVPLVASKADETEPDDLHSPHDEPHDDGEQDEDSFTPEEADLSGDPLPGGDS